MKKSGIIIILSMLMLFFFPKTYGQDDIIMTNGVTVGNIGSEVRYFYDPGGPATDQGSGFFGQNLRDTMTLRTNVQNTVMYILFDSFVMGPGDTLFIFDGPDCNSPVDTYNLVRSPGEIQGSNRAMTFVFHSDDQDIAGLQDGWAARVSAFDTIPTIIRFGKNGLDYSPLTCYAEFYDSGGPDNPILQNNENQNEERYVEFTSPVGTHVKCEFTQFSVNGILKIYDGQFYDPNKRLIGQFCTSTLDNSTNNMPPTLFSTGSTLSFVYKGAANDHSQNKPGWRAIITCVPELFESEGGNPCPEVTNNVLDEYSDLFDPSNKTIIWDCDNPYVMLQASVIATGQYTSDYKVEQLPYDESTMLFGYDVGEPIPWPASVTNRDDKWAAPVQLPFTFTFFGKPYTTIYPSANGIISFDYHEPWSGCAWSTSIPQPSPPYSSTNPPYNYVNCAYLVYEDIDPEPSHCSQNDAIRYGVYEAPGREDCRAFVFNYKDIGLYDCCGSNPSQNYNTYQMVLYEGTNIIDVYIKKRDVCQWNGGRGVIGLQNKTSSQILTVPGRNFGTTAQPLTWTAQTEAWRFTPITPLDELGELTWYINDTNSAPYSHDKLILVGKPDTTVTTYYSVYRFTNASGQFFTLIDTTTILLKVPIVHAASSSDNNYICPGDAATLSATFSQYPEIHPISYKWSSGDTTATCVVNPLESTTYTLTVYFDNGCDNTDTVRVKVTELELPEITGVDTICYGKSTTLTATHPTINQFQWNNNQSGPSITVSPQATFDYVVSVTMTGGCVVTDTMTVTVMPLPIPSFTANPTEIYVENGIGTVTCTDHSNGDYHLIWDFGDVFSNVNIVEDLSEVMHEYTRSGYYTITLTAEDTLGCIDSTKSRVSVEVPYFFYIPNAFTPDGDGVNEYFAPQGQGVDPDQYSMQIFDRSGMLIFSTQTPYDYWDGRNTHGQMCPEGVYVYLIRLVNLNKEDKEYTGTVTLVR